MRSARDDGFAQIILDPTSIQAARVTPRSSTWTCRECGAVLPVSVATCLHAIDVPRPTPRPQTPPRAPSITADTASIAVAFRDAADLVAVHRLSLPDALRAVADRLDAAGR